MQVHAVLVHAVALWSCQNVLVFGVEVVCRALHAPVNCTNLAGDALRRHAKAQRAKQTLWQTMLSPAVSRVREASPKLLQHSPKPGLKSQAEADMKMQSRWVGSRL